MKPDILHSSNNIIHISHGRIYNTCVYNAYREKQGCLGGLCRNDDRLLDIYSETLCTYI